MPNPMTPWHGGECPVPRGTRVDARHRDGEEYFDARAGEPGSRARSWHHDEGSVGDIVAWRLHEARTDWGGMPTRRIDSQMAHYQQIWREAYGARPQQPARVHAADVSTAASGRASLQAYVDDDIDPPTDRPPKGMPTMLKLPAEQKALDLSLTPMAAMIDLLPSPEAYKSLIDRLLVHTTLQLGNRLPGRSMTFRLELGAGRRRNLDRLRDTASALGALAAGNQIVVPCTAEHMAVVAEALGRALDYADLTHNHQQQLLWFGATQFGDTPTAETFLHATSHVPFDGDQSNASFETSLAANGLSAGVCLPLHRLALWQHRELIRLREGPYVAIPEALAKRMDTETLLREIPHLATKGSNKGKIAYTESTRKGVEDIQSVMKPGKYLRRVLKDTVSDQELKDMVAELYSAADFEIKTTAEADKIAEVYMDGPNSCMSHGRDKFQNTIDTDGDWRHPTEAYAHPDSAIELAWVEVQGRPAARVLINTQEKLHSTRYTSDWCRGAKGALDEWLIEQGFRYSPEALDGQPMAIIPLQNGGVLCPYIDASGRPVDDELIIGEGEFHAPHDKGYFYLDGRDAEEDGDEDEGHCDYGDHICHIEDLMAIDGHGDVCDGCRMDNFVRAFVNGSDCTYWMHEDDVIDLGITAGSRYDSADHVADDFDQWQRLDVVPLHDDGYALRTDTLELGDEDGDALDEFVHTDEVWQDPGSAPTAAVDCVEIDGLAIALEHAWFDTTNSEWCLTTDRDPEDDEDLIQVSRYVWRERDSADNVIDECA